MKDSLAILHIKWGCKTKNGDGMQLTNIFNLRFNNIQKKLGSINFCLAGVKSRIFKNKSLVIFTSILSTPMFEQAILRI